MKKITVQVECPGKFIVFGIRIFKCLNNFSAKHLYLSIGFIIVMKRIFDSNVLKQKVVLMYYQSLQIHYKLHSESSVTWLNIYHFTHYSDVLYSIKNSLT